MSICYETFTDRDGLTRFCVRLSEHEVERLDRISRSLESIADSSSW